MSSVTSTTSQAAYESLNPQTEEYTWVTDDNGGMGKDAFLKLLVTQMQNQDPLNPMEGVEFTEQLAQFTEVEQLYQLNDSFGSITAALQTQANYQAIYLVGKDVKAINSSLLIEDEKVSQASFILGEAAAEVYVNIYDEDGQLVRTLDMGAKTAGEYDIDWDGRNSAGGLMPDGGYAFEVVASGAEGEEIEVSPTIQGRVTGVTFDSSGLPWLIVNGLTLNMNSIIEINENEVETPVEEEEDDDGEDHAHA